jgi:hypothetical protein
MGGRVKYGWVLILVQFLLPCPPGLTQTLRQINIEWEESPSAKRYEIEFKNQKGHVQVFESSTAAWKGSLAPDQYTFRVRAKDRRGVAGPWALEEKLNVKVPIVKIQKPAVNSELVVDAAETNNIDFQWTQVMGVKNYILKIFDPNGTELYSQELKENSYQVELAVGNRYRWNVVAISELGAHSDPVEAYFNLLSTMSAKPKLEMPKNHFVRSLRWQVGTVADSVDLTLYRTNGESGNDEIISATRNFLLNENEIPFLAEWPGGHYKAVIYAKKNSKIISTKDEIEFEVSAGDRTPATETRFYVEKFLDRKYGSFAHLNYIASQIDYSSTSPEFNSVAKFKAFTGNLQGGWGFLINEHWGFRLIAGLGGIIIDKKNYLFNEFQVQSFRRQRIALLSDSRFWFGLIRKTLPETSKSLVATKSQVNEISVLGLQFGGDFWYALTGTWGLKAQGQIELPFSSQSSQGGKLQKSSVQRWGGFVTYNLNANRQVHLGYTLSREFYIYNGVGNYSSPSRVDFNGTYFNFQYEVGF